MKIAAVVLLPVVDTDDDLRSNRSSANVHALLQIAAKRVGVRDLHGVFADVRTADAGEVLCEAWDEDLGGLPRFEQPRYIEIIQLPHDDIPGRLWRWRPSLGWHQDEINGEGRIVLADARARGVVNASFNIKEVRTRLDHTLGGAWNDHNANSRRLGFVAAAYGRTWGGPTVEEVLAGVSV